MSSLMDLWEWRYTSGTVTFAGEVLAIPTFGTARGHALIDEGYDYQADRLIEFEVSFIPPIPELVDGCQVELRREPRTGPHGLLTLFHLRQDERDPRIWLTGDPNDENADQLRLEVI